MPEQVSCDCGWFGVVRDEGPTRRLRCPACHAPLLIPPLPPEPVEAAGPAPVFQEPSAEERLGRRARRAHHPELDEVEDWSATPVEEGEPHERHKDRFRPDLIISRGTLTALGLLLVGGVWLAIDLSNDRVPIFSLIFLTLGVIKLIFCLSGAEEA
jgi:hypothetical protein